MNHNKKIILSSIAAIILGLTGCQSNHTITVDDHNKMVTIPSSPQKIVVINYGALDTLDALGQNKRVIGTSLSSLPNYLNQYKKSNVLDTGKMKEPNIEVIKAANPDLIIIGGRQASKQNALTKIAPVINLDVDAQNYLESASNNITLLGKITQSDKIAANYIQSLANNINQAQSLTTNSNKRAIIALHNDGKVMLMNNGTNAALIYDVLNVKRAVAAPANNIIKSAERPKPTFVDNQYIANNKPDIIYLIDRSKAIGANAINPNYFDKKVLAKTGTKVVYLTADIWYLSGGGIESLERQIDEVIEPFK
ncbi:ABC transporter substrate-binding protein [Orbus wheelerorum]|uniref:ABC transporter substrate-binding protein n=1 Tax=Orbus wheelerorum TaxID=3074111 RepID=UPI00370D57DB